jgi:hypothetical protein
MMPALPPPLEEIAQASLKRFEEFIGPVMLPTAKIMGFVEAFETEIRRVIVEARSR